MRDQTGADAAQAAGGTAVLFTQEFAGTVAQRKAIHTVNLTGKQAILRFIKCQFTVEKHFAQADIVLTGIGTLPGIG